MTADEAYFVSGSGLTNHCMDISATRQGDAGSLSFAGGHLEIGDCKNKCV
jgi:hypothetical protein